MTILINILVGVFFVSAIALFLFVLVGISGGFK